MTMEQVRAERARMDDRAKTNGLAARVTRLERCVADDRLGDEAMEMAGEASSMRISLVGDRCDRLESALADARRNTTLLTRLVERMGKAIEEHRARLVCHQFPYLRPLYPWTVIGQAEHDAAMHKEEGPDVRREDCVP